MILHGQYNRKETLGMVADVCPLCGRAVYFEIVNNYRVHHLFFIPLGPAAIAGTSLRCLSCGAEASYSLGEHPRVVPVLQAQNMTLEGLASLTNPGLAHRLQAERAGGDGRPAGSSPFLTEVVEAEAVETPPDPEREAESEEEPEPQPATPESPAQRLRRQVLAYDDDPGGAEILAALEDADQLPERRRETLFLKAEAFLDEQKQLDRVAGVLRSAAALYPKGAGCGAMLVSTLAMYSLYVWFPATRSWLWGPVIFVLAPIASLPVYAVTLRVRAGRWFIRTVLPLAEREQIDLDLLVVSLAALERNKRCPEPIRRMAEGLHVYARVVARRRLRRPGRK